MSVRLICIDILAEIFEKQCFFNTLKMRFATADLPFGNRVILTVLRHLVGLEEVLNRYVHKKFSSRTRILKYILLCAEAELLLMNTPDYAVLNEYVSIARQKTDRFAGGMVNAVLRRIIREKDICLPIVSTPRFPQNFRRILARDYTTDQILNFEKMLSIVPPLDLTVRSDPMFWADKLGGLVLPNGTVRLRTPNLKVSELEGYDDGSWWVQDVSASLPVRLLGNVSGLKILDLCAAPGGKTAQLLAGGAIVTAVDVESGRLDLLKKNIFRLKLQEKLTTCLADGADFLKQTTEMFDAVVLDVPCSATGTYRRHPEVMHLKKEEDVRKQRKIQYELLKASADHVPEGGRILYCTCSLAHDEGERQIERFLTDYPEFSIVLQDDKILTLESEKKFENPIIDKGVLRTFPYDESQNGGMDAFFAVCLKKNERKK